MNKKEDCNPAQTTILHQIDYSIENLTDSKRVSRAKAIRMKCLDCCAYQPLEVRLCSSYDCPLWRYRMGKEERDNLYYQAHANVI